MQTNHINDQFYQSNIQFSQQLYLKLFRINSEPMDSARNQPLMNNNYPPLQTNQGWTPPPPPVNNQWSNNPNNGYNPNPNQNNFNPNANYNHNPYPQPNNGFNNNMPPQNYGGQQPMMPGQQPMPNLNQDKIIIIREHSSMPCRMCGYDGMSTWRQTAGCAAYGWCVCLFCFFWPLFWLPFCMDSCYDTDVVCSRCGQIKGRIQADCC